MSCVLAWVAPPHGTFAAVCGRRLARALRCELQILGQREPVPLAARALVVAVDPSDLGEAAAVAASARCPVLYAQARHSAPALRRALMVLPPQHAHLDLDAALAAAPVRELQVVQLTDEGDMKAMQLLGIAQASILAHLHSHRRRLEEQIGLAARACGADLRIEVRQLIANSFYDALFDQTRRLEPDLVIVPGRLPFTWRRPGHGARLRHVLQRVRASVLTIPALSRCNRTAAWEVN